MVSVLVVEVLIVVLFIIFISSNRSSRCRSSNGNDSSCSSCPYCCFCSWFRSCCCYWCCCCFVVFVVLSIVEEVTIVVVIATAVLRCVKLHAEWTMARHDEPKLSRIILGCKLPFNKQSYAKFLRLHSKVILRVSKHWCRWLKNYHWKMKVRFLKIRN